MQRSPMTRLRDQSFNRLIPNILTLLGLCAGMTAVRCSLRLARFNTKLDNADLPAWTGRFFVGVPAPAAAGLALTPMMMHFEFGPGWYDTPLFVGFVMVAVAGLMVSRIPTYSFKRLKVPAKSVLPTMIGIGLLIAFVISTPWI